MGSLIVGIWPKGKSSHSREETIGRNTALRTRYPAVQPQERQSGMNGPINLQDFRRLEIARAGHPVRGAWIMSLPAALWSKLLRARRVRKARADLNALDERMLRDIGVSRHDIERIARQERRRR